MLQARLNDKEVGLTELDKTQKMLVHCVLSSVGLTELDKTQKMLVHCVLSSK